jgi:hypothetical protein
MERVASELVYQIVFGVMLLIVGAIGYRLARAQIAALYRRYRRHRVSKIGLSAPARVVDVETVDPDLLIGVDEVSGLSGSTGRIYRILLMVEPTIGEPFGADIYTGLSQDELATILPDSTVNVMYDPHNTDIVVLGGASATGVGLGRSSST